jgi:hypothetical protein
MDPAVAAKGRVARRQQVEIAAEAAGVAVAWVYNGAPVKSLLS